MSEMANVLLIFRRKRLFFMFLEFPSGILNIWRYVAEATVSGRFGGRDGDAWSALNGALATDVGKGQHSVILLLTAFGRDRQFTS